MRTESRLAFMGPVFLVVCALAGCTTPPASTAVVPPPPAAATAPAPVPPAPRPEPAQAAAPPAHPLEPVLAYADRVRSLPPADLAAEVQRLGDSAYSPERALQFAVALTQSRNSAQTARAQALLQRVLAQADAEARPFQPFARLLAAQLAEQRRVEEQAERQAQQLRDAQRRIDQLNDRLEAVRAIERSVPAAPRRDNDVPPPARGPASRPTGP
ncbi:hypothetical protein [Caenimonas sedimenti]|uniref:hypothetical protein n=1 Tax=Caenimonas sedimenti TaxID=2596921 RepID=UPI0016443495|nr:hypothetical protein [Caenimonas sedimenti]